MPAGKAIHVARQVLSGLSEIHAQGIVHRDLSPDNVMLREGPGGRLDAKIIDLGIAKRVASDSLARTGTGLFLGKLKYCSPEQAGLLARGETLDGRSDLYSFGVVLYEMLSGKPLFEAATPEAYLGMHLHTPAPPLDTSRLPEAVGRELAAIVRKSLQKGRDRRFRDAEEFRRALEALEPAAEEEAAPAEGPRADGSPARVAMAVVAVVLAAGAAGYALLRRSPSRGSEVPAAAAPATPAAPAFRPPESPTSLPASNEPPRVVGDIERSRAASRSVADPSEAGPLRTPAATGASVPPPPALSHGEDAAEGAPEVPVRMDEEGARRFRRFLKRWQGLPAEKQSSEARLVARLANRFVEAYPDDPLAGELRQRLPGSLAGEARRELDAGRPRVARRFYDAYRELDFGARDGELDRLFAAAPGPKNPD